MVRRFVECSAFVLVAACVGSGLRTHGTNPETRTAFTEYPVASSAPIDTARVETSSVGASAWESWLCADRPPEAAAPDVNIAAAGAAVPQPGASPSPREVAADPDAALRCDLVARIAARGGWSRDDRRRAAVAAWFDGWSAARGRLREAPAPDSAATYRHFAVEQETLRVRLGRDFIADDAAAIARLVPLFAWDEASGSLRRVGADGKPFPKDDEGEVVTTVASN